jgi:hypothetical protein
MTQLLNAANWCGRALDCSASRHSGGSLLLLGPPRSNSTLIHRLLAKHTGVLSPPLKELLFPGRIGGMLRAGLALAPQSRVDEIYDPRLHETGANAPEADDIALMAAYSEGIFDWVYGGALRGAEAPTLEPTRHLPYLSWLRGNLARKHPGRLICSKYFAGVYHYAELRAAEPEAKFVLLCRDPAQVCASVATLVDTVMQTRKLSPKDPTAYWYNLYRFLVATYERMAVLMMLDDPRLLALEDRQVKSDLNGTLAKVMEHAGLTRSQNDDLERAILEKTARGPYRRTYDYGTRLLELYRAEDFGNYFEAAQQLFQ